MSKALRRIVKQVIPYCIQSKYAAKRYGFKEQRDLVEPKGRADRLMRILRGLLPYGLVRAMWPEPKPDLVAIYASFAKTCDRLAAKLGEKHVLKAVFLVSNTSMFPARPLFDAMMRDGSFHPQVIVVPDLRWWGRSPLPAMEECVRILSMAIPQDRLSCAKPNPDGSWPDLLDDADIVCYPSPYELSDHHYNPRFAQGRDFLPIMANYGFYRALYDRFIMGLDAYAYMWIALFECEETYREYAANSIVHGVNAEVVGYVKMDALADCMERRRLESQPLIRRPCILVALHHSIEGGQNEKMQLANFFRYSDYFLSLPDRHPEADFIFRPHPFLRTVLEREDVWGTERTERYFNELSKKTNSRISFGADYFEDFADSDAMIQDCGSYLVEYLYTGKPCCYMLKSRTDREQLFAPLGRKCLDVCYIACHEAQIENFIRNVVVGGEDPKAAERDALAKSVMVNYPHASERAIWAIMERIVGHRSATASSVDVLMATYKPNEEFLKTQRESILNQKAVKVNLIEREDRRCEGACANFAALLKYSHAPYAAFADQDDVWLEDKLSRSLALMHALETKYGPDTPLLVFTDAYVTDGSLNVISPSLFERTRIDPARNKPRQLLLQNTANGNTILINAALRELARPIPEGAFMHDHWLMLVAASFGRIGCLNEPTLLYRQHEKNAIGGAQVDAGYYLTRARDGRSALRRRLYANIRQAEAFTARFGGKTPAAIRAVCYLDRQPRLMRVWTLLRHRIFKNGLLRNLGTLAIV